MRDLDSRSVVHFLDGSEPRQFDSLREAIAFITTYCPAEQAETAWIETNGERVESAEARGLTEAQA